MDNLQPIGFCEMTDSSTKDITIEGSIKFSRYMVIDSLITKRINSRDFRQFAEEQITSEITRTIMAWLKQYAPHELQYELDRAKRELLDTLRARGQLR